MEKYFLAYDIGGTDIKYAVLNRHGHLIEKHKVATPSTGTEIVEQLVEIKQSLENNYPFEGAAFSVPGMVAPVEGFLQTGGAIADFYGFPFREVLGAKLQMPVEVENDVNCVALAEKWLGKAKNCQNFLCVTIGTGVGGAVYANDQLVRGHANMAGEFGYMLTNACHNSQNQPTTLSFTGSIREGLRRQYIQRKQTLSIEDISGKDIYSFAEKGDEIAKQVIECFYKNIAVGLYNLIFILNPEKIIIGGAISTRQEIYASIKNHIQRLIDSEGSIRGHQVDSLVNIESAQFGNDAGLIGAVYHFLNMTKSRTDSTEKPEYEKTN